MPVFKISPRYFILQLSFKKLIGHAEILFLNSRDVDHLKIISQKQKVLDMEPKSRD